MNNRIMSVRVNDVQVVDQSSPTIISTTPGVITMPASTLKINTLQAVDENGKFIDLKAYNAEFGAIGYEAPISAVSVANDEKDTTEREAQDFCVTEYRPGHDLYTRAYSTNINVGGGRKIKVKNLNEARAYYNALSEHFFSSHKMYATMEKGLYMYVTIEELKAAKDDRDNVGQSTFRYNGDIAGITPESGMTWLNFRNGKLIIGRTLTEAHPFVKDVRMTKQAVKENFQFRKLMATDNIMDGREIFIAPNIWNDPTTDATGRQIYTRDLVQVAKFIAGFTKSYFGTPQQAFQAKGDGYARVMYNNEANRLAGIRNSGVLAPQAFPSTIVVSGVAVKVDTLFNTKLQRMTGSTLLGIRRLTPANLMQTMDEMQTMGTTLAWVTGE